MLVKGLDRVNDFALQGGVLSWMIFSVSLCTLCASLVKMFAEELTTETRRIHSAAEPQPNAFKLRRSRMFIARAIYKPVQAP